MIVVGRYLTARFLAYFMGVQLVGLLALRFSLLFELYLVSALYLAYLTWRDRSELSEQQLTLSELELSRVMELGYEGIVRLTLGGALPAGELRWLPPKSDLLFFAGEPQRFSQHHDNPGQISSEHSFRAIRLGSDRLERLRLQAFSSRRLWFELVEFRELEQYFRVSPPYREIPESELARIALRQGVFAQGQHTLLRQRAADQFRSLREYRYPDSVRRIDPRKTAKFQRLMTREYDSGERHHLVLGLDLGRDMVGGVSDSHKVDYYLAVCFALAKFAVSQGDRVSFIAFSQRIHLELLNGQRLSDFYALQSGDSRLRPETVESSFELFGSALARAARQRSIVLLFTDFSKPAVQQTLLAALAPIGQKHLTSAVSLVEDRYELRQVLSDSSEQLLAGPGYARLLYSYWLADSLRTFQTHASQSGAGALAIPEQYWLSAALKVYALLRSSLRS